MKTLGTVQSKMNANIQKDVMVSFANQTHTVSIIDFLVLFMLRKWFPSGKTSGHFRNFRLNFRWTIKREQLIVVNVIWDMNFMTKAVKTLMNVKTLNETFWHAMAIRPGSKDFWPRTKIIRQTLIRPVNHFIKNVLRILDVSTKKVHMSVTVTLVTNVWIFQNLQESRWVWGEVDLNQGQADANQNVDRLLWKFAILRNVASELIATFTTKMMLLALVNRAIKETGIHEPLDTGNWGVGARSSRPGNPQRYRYKKQDFFMRTNWWMFKWNERVWCECDLLRFRWWIWLGLFTWFNELNHIVRSFYIVRQSCKEHNLDKTAHVTINIMAMDSERQKSISTFIKIIVAIQLVSIYSPKQNYVKVGAL